MVRNLFFILILATISFACSKNASKYKAVIPSPDAKLHIYFELNNGEPYYMVYFRNEVVIKWSSLGLITSADSLTNNLNFKNTKTGISSKSIDQGLDAVFDLDAVYNDMLFTLAKADEPEKEINILFRAYNNGIAFRYIAAPGDNEESITLVQEVSSIRLPATSNVLIDTLKSPFQIRLANGLEIELFDQELKTFPEAVYVLDKKDRSKYNLVTGNENITHKIDDHFLSPWRSYRFSIIKESKEFN